MQALFLMWNRGELVRVDCLRVVSDDPRKAAVAQLRKGLWAGQYPAFDRCTMYLVEGGKLVMAGEGVMRHDNGIPS